MKEREKLEIWRRLDKLARENPELYQKAMFEAADISTIDATASMLEKKERCRCDL